MSQYDTMSVNVTHFESMWLNLTWSDSMWLNMAKCGSMWLNLKWKCNKAMSKKTHFIRISLLVFPNLHFLKIKFFNSAFVFSKAFFNNGWRCAFKNHRQVSYQYAKEGGVQYPLNLIKDMVCIGRRRDTRFNFANFALTNIKSICLIPVPWKGRMTIILK